MLSNYEVSQFMELYYNIFYLNLIFNNKACDCLYTDKKNVTQAFLSNCVCVFQLHQVFQLLTELKEKRKESVKNKHSTGQQNLNTIMYEVSDVTSEKLFKRTYVDASTV